MKTSMFVDSSRQVAIRGLGLCVLTLPLLLLASGCSSSSTGSISGKVTYKNQPLQGGRVMFAHENGSFYAIVAEDGTYKVDRVPVGKVKIAVLSGGQAAGGPAISGGGRMTPQMEKKLSMMKRPGKIDVPEQYASPEKSGLTYEVQSGSQAHDIDLK